MRLRVRAEAECNAGRTGLQSIDVVPDEPLSKALMTIAEAVQLREDSGKHPMELRSAFGARLTLTKSAEEHGLSEGDVIMLCPAEAGIPADEQRQTSWGWDDLRESVDREAQKFRDSQRLPQSPVRKSPTPPRTPPRSPKAPADGGVKKKKKCVVQ